MIRHSALLLLCAASLTTVSFGQVPFNIRVEQGQSAATIPNNSSLTVSASAVGQTTSLRFIYTYRGTTTARVEAPELFGSADFTVTSDEAPVTLQPGQSFQVSVQYRASTANAAVGQLIVGYTEAPAGQDGSGTRGSLVTTITGTAPDFLITYALQTDNNVVPVRPGSQILFDDTEVNTITSAAITVLNRGSGPGTVESIAYEGPPLIFRILGLPLLPTTLRAGESIRFSLRYAPTEIGDHFAALNFVFGDGPASVGIEAHSIGPVFTYEQLLEESRAVVEPGSTVSFPEVNLGETSTITIFVRNDGNGPGTIALASVTGSGFALSQAPPLPQTLRPRSSLEFTVSFTPTQAGTATGRLRVGQDTFELRGNGLGTRLTYAYDVTTSRQTVAAGGQVIFAPAQVGQSSQTAFAVRNSGTAPATIANIGVVEGRTIYSITDLPTLPFTLAPQEELHFRINHAPNAVGFSSGTLRIQGTSFALVGSGTEPPPLPPITFSAQSGNVGSMTQVPVGLTLAEPYPVEIVGTLTVTIVTDHQPDPAVQFSNGARTITFRVPANTTEAVFPDRTNRVRLQTGSVAATLDVRAALTTEGGAELLAPSDLVLLLTVPPGPPQLSTVVLPSFSSTSLLVRVSGFAPSRSLQRLQFTFTPASGFTLENTRVEVDVTAVATEWFASSQSASFGSQFSINVPFTLGIGTDETPPLEGIQSISVVAVNDLGTSNSVSVNVR